MTKQIIQLKGPHHKTCACGCGTEFYGRKNQKYFDTIHKAKANNAKRSDELQELSPWFKEMEIAYRILQDALSKLDENGWIYIGELTKHGFNPDCATKEGTSKTGAPFKYILDIAYRLSDDKKHVQIIKM